MIDGTKPISEFMTPAPRSIEADLTLADGRERMASDGIRHLPVFDDDRLVGIVSARDIILLEALPGIDPEEATVAAAMTANPATCAPDTSLLEVLNLMNDRHLGAVPITNKGDLLGIFTDVDAVRLLRDALS